MFAIRGDDESDPEEDLLEKGTRRLQMIPSEALSAPGSGEQSSFRCHDDFGQLSSQPLVTPVETMSACTSQQLITPTSVVSPGNDTAKCGADLITSRSESCVCRAESAESPHQRSPTVIAEAPRYAYKPEVDGPPIVGYACPLWSAFVAYAERGIAKSVACGALLSAACMS